MNYDLTEDQNIIKDTARKFLAKECTSEYVRAMVEDERGYTDDLWRQMADLGWMSLLVPEEYGGFGGTFPDLAVLMGEMGYCCLPGPFFSSTVLGGLTVMEACSPEQKADILPGLATGDRILALAWLEEGGDYAPGGINLEAVEQDGDYVLSGTKLFVANAHVADTLIVAARTGSADNDPESGISLLLVDAATPGLTMTPLITLAGDKQSEVVFDQVRVPGMNLLGTAGAGWPVLRNVTLMAGVAKSAEMSGAAERVMELVVPYTKERVQFGRPIGSFQAVQHHCANMLTYADTIKFMVYQAAWRIGAGLPFEKEAAMCKAWVSDAHHKLVALGHQVMGGIGFMEEHDLQLYYKRAKAAELMMGDADFHRELVAQAMGL